jgi:hypothetical protein
MEKERTMSKAFHNPLFPLPALLPLLDISKIDGSRWTNPTFDTSDPNWSSNVVGGHTFDGYPAHKFEWVSILNPNDEQDDEVSVAGTVLSPELSGADLPFTHPFGPDFEFTIVPDSEYEPLLAPANKTPNGVYAKSWTAAQAAGIAIPTGVLGVEIDAALVPPNYHPASGDRVAVYGRWIVDAGHPEFHTEIHPPLLLAHARSIDSSGNLVPRSASATTLFQLWSRPYQAGQLFSTNGATGLALHDYAVKIAETPFKDVQAFPPVFAKPFQGVHLVSFTIRPPVPAPQITTALAPKMQLQCSYHFTVNGSCRVEVMSSPAEPNSVLVILALNSVGYPPLPEPASQLDKYSIQSLLNQAPSGVDLNWFEQEWLHIKGDVFVRRFAAPHMSQTQDSVNVVPFTPLTALPSSSQATDSTQPFPVYGWVKLQWVNVMPTKIG